MKLSSRHQIILEKIKKETYVDVIDLCDFFNVSAVTIRKDLKVLENKGLLFRTHGGASLESPYIKDKPINEKEKLNSEEKHRIAEHASKLVKSGDTIIIASGTTIQSFANQLQSKGKLTVICASLNAALKLITNTQIEVFQLGGTIRHGSSSVIGTYATDLLKSISCNTLFMGADGIDPEFGISTTSIDEAHLNQKMMASANKTILLADSTKFGKKSFGKICNIDEVDEIFTDSKLNPSIKTAIEESGVKITIV